MEINKKIYASRENGKKGGRPKTDVVDKIKLKNAQLVSLTETQYVKLSKRYGEIKLQKAIEVLNDWFNTGSKEAVKHIGKNNYSFFRQDGWVINSIK